MVAVVGRCFGRRRWLGRGGLPQELVNALRSVLWDLIEILRPTLGQRR